MKIIFLIITIFIFSLSIQAKEKKTINKKDIAVIGLTLINPAISIGTLVTNTSAFQKIISMANIIYINTKGHSVAETAISQSRNKKCLIDNLKTKKDFCI